MSDIQPISCTIKRLDVPEKIQAARTAVAINPENHPMVGPDTGPLRKVLLKDAIATPQRIAFLTTCYWGSGGVHLTVGFLDNAPADLQARILSHANAWGKRANIKFSLTNTDPQVRITRTPGDGYYSYLGTDILTVPADQNTMNLDSFTMQTEDREFYRVVRHEFGHTLGAPHEHQRAQEIARLNKRKTLQYFRTTQGWSNQEIQQQVLTPLDDSTFLFSSPADEKSIMCYDMPGSITLDGKPILGGMDINDADYDAAGLIYPIQTA